MVALEKIYLLSPAVAIEDFGDRSLALHCEDLRLIELNATARTVLVHFDGQATLGQVAEVMANHFQQPLDVVQADVQEVAAQMLELGLVEQAG